MVCCTRRLTGAVLVDKFIVEGNPKVSDLICPINVFMKEFFFGGGGLMW